MGLSLLLTLSASTQAWFPFRVFDQILFFYETSSSMSCSLFNSLCFNFYSIFTSSINPPTSIDGFLSMHCRMIEVLPLPLLQRLFENLISCTSQTRCSRPVDYAVDRGKKKPVHAIRGPPKYPLGLNLSTSTLDLFQDSDILR